MAGLSRDFPLDSAILGKGSSANVAVSGATNPATLAAIATNGPFPSAAELGRVSLGIGTGPGIQFAAGDAAVSFKGATSVGSSVGIFDGPGEALKALTLDGVNAIDLRLPARPGTRWAMMQWQYDISGTMSGSHPIGAIGAATLGIDASRSATYAVLHAFDASAGAQDVLAATVRSWRLPRHVNLDGGDINITPSTWIVTEADGAIALTLAARLGYDVSFTHESALLGLTRDLGAKLDANLKATLGLHVEGRYVIVVGREEPDPRSRVIRFRLYKQTKQGLGIGLNLNVGVKAISPVPRNFDAFVQTVFGVHGPQVLKDLHVLEEWTDPSKDLAQTAARLTTTTGLDLLQHATGLDLQARFHAARQIVVEALGRWNRLPEPVSSMLWGLLSRTTPEETRAGFRKFLSTLAGPELETRRAAVATALQQAPVSDNLITRWLQAVAGRGLLAVSDDLDRLGEMARDTLAVLDGGVMEKVQQFVTTKLDLTPLRQAIKDDDFGAVEEWLVRRLADLLNKPELHLADLKQVQQAIFAVDARARALYDQGVKALTKRYSADVAAKYEATRGDTALLDVSFDLGVPVALERFRALAQGGGIDDLLLSSTDGVRTNEATLTHAVRQQANIELRLPFITADSTRVMESLAKLSVEEQAGRVLLYEFDATDTVTTANRARSELSVLGRLGVDGAASATISASATIAYEARQVQRAMSVADFEARTRPFIGAYLGPLFQDGDASIEAFYKAVGASAESGGRTLGDVGLSTELSYPARVLEGWLVPRDKEAVRRDSMRLSRAIQASIKPLLARTYFDDLDHLRVLDPVAALLVWSSLPVSTSVDTHASILQFNTDRDVFWDYVNPEERRRVAGDPHTIRALQARLAEAHSRLSQAGKPHAASFEPRDAERFIQRALQEAGAVYLGSLLNAEALMIGGAVRALGKIAEAVGKSRTAPAAAVRALSEFAAALVQTFSGELQFVYSREAVRTLGPMVLAEASRALHPEFQTALPSAALRVYRLKTGHAFKLEDFVKGELPSADNVSTAETLVRV